MIQQMIEKIITNDIITFFSDRYDLYLSQMENNIINVHVLSPIIYCSFIFFHKLFNPCPNSSLMKKLRLYHNVNLSLFSFVMMIGITYSTYYSNKFESINSLFCIPFKPNDTVMIMSSLAFLYSKYLEWIDTTFLYFGNKRISWLQYTHHMSTALLTYYNLDSPYMFVPIFLNTFVHTPMYWYFAFPRGILFPIRSLITQTQIVQHILCLLVILFTYISDNCNQNPVGHLLGLLLYSMYLIFFILFYIEKYLKISSMKED